MLSAKTYFLQTVNLDSASLLSAAQNCLRTRRFILQRLRTDDTAANKKDTAQDRVLLLYDSPELPRRLISTARQVTALAAGRASTAARHNFRRLAGAVDPDNRCRWRNFTIATACRSCMAAGGPFRAPRYRRRLCALHQGALVAAASALTIFLGGHIALTVRAAALGTAGLAIGHFSVFAHRALIGATRTAA